MVVVIAKRYDGHPRTQNNKSVIQAFIGRLCLYRYVLLPSMYTCSLSRTYEEAIFPLGSTVRTTSGSAFVCPSQSILISVERTPRARL